MTKAPAFVELLAKSAFSFLQSSSQPEEMVERAQALGYSGLGITDCDGFYGSVRAHVMAEKLGFPVCHGAEVILQGNFRIFLIAKSRQGYGDLSELLSEGHLALENGAEQRPEISLKSLAQKCSELFAILPGSILSLPADDRETLCVEALKKIFGNRFYFSACHFLDGTSSLEKVSALSQHYQVPVIASNEPLFHLPERKSLHDVLTCIRHSVPLTDAGLFLLPNAERHLKTREQIALIFRNYPEWIQNTVRIFEQCQFSLSELRYHYPSEWIPAGYTNDSFLEKLVQEGIKKRYPEGAPADVLKQIESEMALIQDLQYSDYFLTIWDVVTFARSQGILCQGRGSAANSCVCFVLEITSIDPVRMGFLFERFLSRERREPPDIDIDFEHERREEVIQYIYGRYGRNRAAITAEVICFRRKSALREVAKVFQIPETVVESFKTLTHRMSRDKIQSGDFAKAAPHLSAATLHQYLEHTESILNFPRHIGTHVGGFVLCQELLTRNVPVENAAMENRTIVQWDKNDLDVLGFVRVDVLGLGILSCIRRCFDILEKQFQRPLTLATVPAEDPKVYDQICKGDTVGVFQIESRAQMNMLPRLKPRNFYDLVVEISIVRPGPIQGQMIHPYLKRRAGEEKIEYAHPELEPILKRTFGVPIFQEQVMKMAMQVAGFSGGEADALRRGMGTWRRSEHGLRSMKERFEKGLVQKGIPPEFAERVFSQIQGFAEYGFPESHAASFSILVYVTSWLRHHYPDVYLTAILNAQPMGFYSKSSLIHDGERHGVKTLPIHIQKSGWDNRLEEPGVVRMGFRETSGLAKATGIAIEAAHQGTDFSSFEDFVQRVSEALKPLPLTKRDLFLLASAHAFDCLEMSRREALWKIQGLSMQDSPWQDFQPEDARLDLPNEKRWEKIRMDYEAQSVCLSEHPVAFLRPHLERSGVCSSQMLLQRKHGEITQVAGMIICRQMPPTAKGVCFITLEDEFGFSNLIIWNATFNKFRSEILENSFIVATGKIQRSAHGKVVNLLVESIEGMLAHLPATSHDFH